MHLRDMPPPYVLERERFNILRMIRNEGRTLQEVTKVLGGIHVLPSRSLFACDIPRRLLRPVSLAKSTSAPLRF